MYELHAREQYFFDEEDVRPELIRKTLATQPGKWTMPGCVGRVVMLSLATLLCSNALVARAQSTYTLEQGFDRPGAEYDSFEQTGSLQSPDLCRDACDSQPQCRSFTYVKPGVEGPRARCRLKNAAPPPVENVCCISGVKGGRPTQPAVRKTIQLAWRGWDADKVGHETTDGQPDGRPDHHFRLFLNFESPQELVSIALYDADDQGIPTRSHHWSSRDSEFSILGVETEGHRLNPNHVPSLGRFSGNVVFDLFAADYGWWDTGSFVLVEVELADGRKLGQWIRLEPPEGRLIGKWSILCPNTSPQAFEPMTLSGRFFMDVGTDGRITGSFGGHPISGSVDQPGTASGTAGSATDSITWQGTISKPARSKPLSGKGDFKFHQRGQECFGGAWWSD